MTFFSHFKVRFLIQTSGCRPRRTVSTGPRRESVRNRATFNPLKFYRRISSKNERLKQTWPSILYHQKIQIAFNFTREILLRIFVFNFIKEIPLKFKNRSCLQIYKRNPFEKFFALNLLKKSL